jgi:hypothetical protein
VFGFLSICEKHLTNMYESRSHFPSRDITSTGSWDRDYNVEDKRSVLSVDCSLGERMNRERKIEEQGSSFRKKIAVVLFLQGKYLREAQENCTPNAVSLSYVVGS